MCVIYVYLAGGIVHLANRQHNSIIDGIFGYVTIYGKGSETWWNIGFTNTQQHYGNLADLLNQISNWQQICEKISLQNQLSEVNRFTRISAQNGNFKVVVISGMSTGFIYSSK